MRKFPPDSFQIVRYIRLMSATEIMSELPKLSDSERLAVLDALIKLVCRGDSGTTTATYREVDLRLRGVSEADAASLRSRLKTFTEDWERPEMNVYDED